MKVAKLRDIFEIKKGKKIKQVDFKTSDSVRYIQIDDLRNDNSLKYCVYNEKNIYANPEDIIIAWDGANAGTIGFGLSGHIGSTLAVLKLRKELPYEIDTHYLGLYLKSKQQFLRDNCTGSTIPHISRAVLNDMELPVPNISIQRKIVENIYLLEQIISKRKEQSLKLSNLKQNLFFEMFGDPINNKNNYKVSTLSDYAILVSSGSTPRGGRKVYQKHGIPLIRSQNVLTNELSYKDIAYIPEDIHLQMKRSMLNRDDVLLNITGASIGRSAVYQGESNKANVNQHVCIIRTTNELNSIFLSHYLNSYFFQKNYVSKNIGATRQAFNYSQIKSFKLIVPPLDEQQKFEKRIVDINKNIKQIEKSLFKMNKLYKSIFHYAF